MATVMQSSFCGNSSVFWDPQLTLNTSVPDLTPCFQDVLSCVPLVVLILASLCYLPYLSSLPVLYSTRHRTRLCCAKLVLSSSLFVLELLSLGYSVILSLQIFTCPGCYLPPPSKYTNAALHLLAYIFIIILVEVEFTRGQHTSGVCFIFWLLEVLVKVIIMRSVVMQQKARETHDVFVAVVTGIVLGVTFIQFLLTLFPDVVVTSSSSSERIPLLNDQKHPQLKTSVAGKPSPETRATFLSQVTHFWLTGLLIRGFRKTLQSRDLYDLKADDTCAAIEPRFRTSWRKFENANSINKPQPEVVFREPRPRHLLGVLLTTAKWPLVTAAFLRLVICFSEYLNPLLLIILIKWVGNKDPYLWKGILLCFVILLINIINSVLTQLFFKHAQVTSMRVRTALVTAIYRKTLRLSHSTQHKMGSGEIANLMSVDAQKIHDTCNDMHELWAGPIMVIIGMAFLWQVIGPSCLAGLALIVLLAPINGGFLVRRFASYQDQQMALKDQRIHLISEILAGIKVLKLYAWELAFSAKVDDVRNKELRTVRSQGYLNAGVGVIWYCTPYLVSLAMFSTYVLTSRANYLKPDITFVSLLLINTLNWSMTFIPILLATAAQAYVSVKRITGFMKQDEINPDDVNNDETEEPAIRIKNGSFSWDANEENGELKDINLDIGDGQLVVVVGQVGSGKSSLVAAILGEMPRRHGYVNVRKAVAYVAQQAWIQNDTLRNNILFGKDFDPHLYQKVVRACALEQDLKQLPAGDHTEIGEKGINLSGGQKQRVALARAVYQNRDIYLLDDPLSAVDAHVARHIFEHVIGPSGLLQRKTRLLVTHSIPYGSEADLIVVMKNGHVTEAGSFLQLVNQSAGNFASLAVSYLNKTEDGAEEVHDLSAAISLKEMTFANDLSGAELSALLTSSTTSEKDTNGTTEILTPAKPAKIKKQTSRRRKRSSSHRQDVTSSMKFCMESQTMDDDITDRARLMTEEASAEGSISLKVLWSYIKACSIWMTVFLAILQLLYIFSLAVTSIWLSAWTDDGATSPPTEQQTNFRLEVFAGLGIMQMFSVGGISIVIYLGGLWAAGTLHQGMLSRIVKAPMWFFDTTPLGRIVNRFSTDMDKLDSNIPQSTRLWLFNLASLCSIIVVIIYSTPIFVAVAVPIFLIYVIIQRIYIKFIRQVKRIDAVKRSPVYIHFDETLAGISTIRAFHQEARFIATCDHLVDESQTAWYPIKVGQRWLAVLLDILGALVVFFAALFAVLERDSLSPGLAGLSVSFAMQISWAVNMLVRGASDLETHMVAVERVQEYSQVPNEGPLYLDHEAEDDWPTEGRINFHHYSAHYRPGTENILNDITFNINSAEKFAIIGRTGAGKSSIALALFRMLEPSGGSVCVDDVNVARLGLHRLRRRLAVIPQDPLLFSGSLRHNLDPLEVHDDSAIWQALKHAHLKEFVESLPAGLEHDCGESGSSLSVGQRQLVCLARALLRNSKVLVLDEATAAVDGETDQLIQSSLRNNLGSSTLITIAHRINTILDYDRVCVMENGTIQEIGNPDDLLKMPLSIFRQMAVEAGLVH